MDKSDVGPCMQICTHVANVPRALVSGDLSRLPSSDPHRLVKHS